MSKNKAERSEKEEMLPVISEQGEKVSSITEFRIGKQSLFMMNVRSNSRLMPLQWDFLYEAWFTALRCDHNKWNRIDFIGYIFEITKAVFQNSSETVTWNGSEATF